MKVEKTKRRAHNGCTAYVLTIDDRTHNQGDKIITLAELLAEIRKAYPDIPDDKLFVNAAVGFDYDNTDSTGINIGYAANKELPTDTDFIEERFFTEK